MRIAYARVSTPEQSLDLQIDAFDRVGYDLLFEDHGASGSNTDRPGLDAALAALKPGDTLIVWRLDRLARSIFDLADLLRTFKSQGIAFRSINDGMDTDTPFGECMYMVAGAFAHLERSIMIERTREGMAAAKARGAQFGRAPVLDSEQIETALTRIRDGQSVTQIAEQMNVGRSTLYRYLKQYHLSGLR